MSDSAHVVGVVGSLRDGSYTRLGVGRALDGVRRAGGTAELLDLREYDLPTYDADHDEAGTRTRSRRGSVRPTPSPRHADVPRLVLVHAEDGARLLRLRGVRGQDRRAPRGRRRRISGDGVRAPPPRLSGPQRVGDPHQVAVPAPTRSSTTGTSSTRTSTGECSRWGVAPCSTPTSSPIRTRSKGSRTSGRGDRYEARCPQASTNPPAVSACRRSRRRGRLPTLPERSPRGPRAGRSTVPSIRRRRRRPSRRVPSPRCRDQFPSSRRR